MLNITHAYYSLDSYLKYFSCNANFIFVRNITWNKLMVKVCYWEPCKENMSYNLGRREYYLDSYIVWQSWTLSMFREFLSTAMEFHLSFKISIWQSWILSIFHDHELLSCMVIDGLGSPYFIELHAVHMRARDPKC